MEIIKTALTSYHAKTGYYIQQPTAGDFLVDEPKTAEVDFTEFINYEKMKNSGELGDKVSGSSEQRPLVDPFGNKTNYRYQCPGTRNRGSFDLWSAGPDGKDATDDDRKDDIKNWE